MLSEWRMHAKVSHSIVHSLTDACTLIAYTLKYQLTPRPHTNTRNADLDAHRLCICMQMFFPLSQKEVSVLRRLNDAILTSVCCATMLRMCICTRRTQSSASQRSNPGFAKHACMIKSSLRSHFSNVKHVRTNKLCMEPCLLRYKCIYEYVLNLGRHSENIREKTKKIQVCIGFAQQKREHTGAYSIE